MIEESKSQRRKRLQTERWRRNKRAERSRLRQKREAEKSNSAEVTLDPEFLEKLWAERDKRRTNFPWRMPVVKDGDGPKHFPNSSNFASQDLVCDVWAAEVILNELNPGAVLTPGKIANFLISEGRTHDVKPASLRVKVERVRPIVQFLGQSAIWDREGPYWPKFPESIQEHGSWIKQHANQVMAGLGVAFPNHWDEETIKRAKNKQWR